MAFLVSQVRSFNSVWFAAWIPTRSDTGRTGYVFGFGLNDGLLRAGTISFDYLISLPLS